MQINNENVCNFSIYEENRYLVMMADCRTASFHKGIPNKIYSSILLFENCRNKRFFTF